MRHKLRVVRGSYLSATGYTGLPENIHIIN